MGPFSPDDDAASTDPHTVLRRAAGRAVKRWDSFPYNAAPLPTVLLDSPARVDGSFATGDAKVGVPLRRHDRRPVGARRSGPSSQTTTSSRRSVTAKATEGHPCRAGRGRFCHRSRRAALPGVEGRGGRQQRVHLGSDRTGPEQVLGSLCAYRASRAACAGPRRPDSDAQGLTVIFVGGPPSLFNYDAEVIESAAAVTVIPLRRTIKQLPERTFITAGGHPAPFMCASMPLWLAGCSSTLTAQRSRCGPCPRQPMSPRDPGRVPPRDTAGPHRQGRRCPEPVATALTPAAVRFRPGG